MANVAPGVTLPVTVTLAPKKVGVGVGHQACVDRAAGGCKLSDAGQDSAAGQE